MKIDFTKEQYKLLIKLVMLGTNVEAAVLEARELPYEKVYDLEDYLLARVDKFELDALAEEEDGRIFPSRKLEKEVDRTMREYDDDTFWLKLETELGQRDFYETLSFKEMRAIKEGETEMPETVKEFYEKYADEFDRHKIDRLRIVPRTKKE